MTRACDGMHTREPPLAKRMERTAARAGWRLKARCLVYRFRTTRPVDRETRVDRHEKKRLREHIGEHLDVSGARLSDDEAEELAYLIDNYDEYRGQSQTRTRSHVDWSSDGKYTREETWTETFTDNVGIRTDYSYQDDDGQSDKASAEISDARGMLNLRRDHGWPQPS